jgi:hypothetical protein
MAHTRFAVGDLVDHKDAGDSVFVVESWLEPADGDRAPLYQCSLSRSCEFAWHNYIGSDLRKAETVSDEQRPDTIKRAAMILNRLLESTQDGGMRQKRAEQLFEEFCDHWLHNDDPDKMDLLSHALDHIEELLRNTKGS